jgi:hypothetical protein
LRRIRITISTNSENFMIVRVFLRPISQKLSNSN